MTPLYIIHRSPTPGERWIIYDCAVLRATFCCWCSRANQATCTIRGGYLDSTQLTQPAVGAVELIKQLALFSKLLDYLDKLFT